MALICTSNSHLLNVSPGDRDASLPGEGREIDRPVGGLLALDSCNRGEINFQGINIHCQALEYVALN